MADQVSRRNATAIGGERDELHYGSVESPPVAVVNVRRSNRIEADSVLGSTPTAGPEIFEFPFPFRRIDRGHRRIQVHLS